MHDTPTPDLLAAYLANACSPDESRRIAAWAETPAGRDDLARARAAWDVAEPPAIAFESAAHIAHLTQMLARTDHIFAKSVQAIPAAPHAESLRPPLTTRHKPTHRLRNGVIAAGLAAIAALFVVIPRIGGPSVTEPVPREYTTLPGQRATITLDDGTQVLLNVASRLVLPQDFGISTRTVQLYGEAQFVVTHNASRPFAVEAQGTLVRDLATTFTVRSYAGTDTRVAVSDGRVSVQSPMVTGTGAVTLDAGESAVVTSQGTRVSKGSDPAAFAWTQGRLIVRNEPLGNVLADLRRWYGLEFRVADDALLSKRVSVVLTQEFQLSMLNVLAEVVGARLVREGDVVTFMPLPARTGDGR